jgi:hypothetical protein
MLTLFGFLQALSFLYALFYSTSFLAALKRFVDEHGCLPVSGQLPDMTSDSKSYATLLNIYRQKALEDAQEVYNNAQELMKILGLEETQKNGHSLTFSQYQNFCKFSAFIGVQKGYRENRLDQAKELQVCISNYTEQ